MNKFRKWFYCLLQGEHHNIQKLDDVGVLCGEWKCPACGYHQKAIDWERE